MVMKKNLTLYERDEKGELIPQEVILETENVDELSKFKGQTIKIVPIPRGKIKRIFAKVNDTDDGDDKDLDGEIILEHCFDPKYNEKEIAHMKPALATAIVNTVLRESGLDTNKNKKKSMLKAEDDFAKN